MPLVSVVNTSVDGRSPRRHLLDPTQPGQRVREAATGGDALYLAFFSPIGPEPYWQAARVGFDLMLPNGICQVRRVVALLAGTGEVSRLA
jgi:hypothetical protein